MNREKRYVVAEAGITLHDLHAQLAEHGLAMINVGSISDQTLAGIVTTATHGSGMNYGVMSTQVMALTLLLADGSRVTCSRNEREDLFMASICGLGSTGLILSIQLEVEPAFRLQEVQETLEFDDVVAHLDEVAHAAEHVRIWWFPSAGTMRVSSSDRTQEVCSQFLCASSINDVTTSRKDLQQIGYGTHFSDITSSNSSCFWDDFSCHLTHGLVALLPGWSVTELSALTTATGYSMSTAE